MIEGFAVEPARLVVAAGRVGQVARELATAGREAVRALDDVEVPGSPTGAAVAEVAAAAGAALRSLSVATEALAAALTAAAHRYVDADVIDGGA